jgi:alginate O-acetyltransferase complex protein AlgI
MLLGGLWHGAGWTFIVWGGYHGVLLVAYHAWGRTWDQLPAIVRQAAMFLLVLIGWVFFRAVSFSMAGSLLHTMFVPKPGPLMAGALGLTAVLAVAAVVAHILPNASEIKHQWRPIPALGLTVVFALSITALYAAYHTPFVYFQF